MDPDPDSDPEHWFCCCLFYNTLHESSVLVCYTVHCSRVLLFFILKYTAGELCCSLFYCILEHTVVLLQFILPYNILRKSSAVVYSIVYTATYSSSAVVCRRHCSIGLQYQ
jgi:hypothetical protein